VHGEGPMSVWILCRRHLLQRRLHGRMRFLQSSRKDGHVQCRGGRNSGSPRDVQEGGPGDVWSNRPVQRPGSLCEVRSRYRVQGRNVLRARPDACQYMQRRRRLHHSCAGPSCWEGLRDVWSGHHQMRRNLRWRHGQPWRDLWKVWWQDHMQWLQHQRPAQPRRDLRDLPSWHGRQDRVQRQLRRCALVRDGTLDRRPPSDQRL
jgi:hypothetical protein